MSELFMSIQHLKGVGEKKAKAYAKLGVETVYDLLFHFPRGYVDFTHTVTAAQAPMDEYSVIKGKIVRKLPEQFIRKGLSIFKCVANDGESDFIVTIYNNFYGFKALKTDEIYYFYGKVSGNLLRREVSSPKIVSEGDTLFQPIYPMTTGLSSLAIQVNVKTALEILEREPFDSMPSHILLDNNMCALPTAIKNIHFPKDQHTADMARRRLAFDELLNLQLGMLMLKRRNRQHSSCIMNRDTDITPFYKSLPFNMTEAQTKSVGDIISDLCGDVPMNRLLQGDVGSGKTAVAAAACYFAAENGYQSALMAPTEILAAQHFKTLTEFLEPLGVKVALLTGSMKAKEKNDVKKRLLRGEVDVVAGTHAIIQKDVEFQKLGLVITDEQHRFGVAQRAALADKGESAHKLIMSATPIPRTLALIIYGDLDISVINEMPKGRLPIETYAVTGKLRQRAYGFVKNQLELGHQAYVVCSLIDESESELLAATSYAEKLKGSAELGEYSVGLLHGKMKATEKDGVMNSFKNGEIDILVCTTVVEVGVDVPNATIMLIENAERFGLSQLHQLRGRVGRSNNQSYCVMITDNLSEECKHRLKTMSSTSDGFKISEEDLKMRGPGDFFGQKQHGLPPLKVADIASDMELVNIARDTAAALLEKDPELDSKENRGLKIDVIRLFSVNGENGLN